MQIIKLLLCYIAVILPLLTGCNNSPAPRAQGRVVAIWDLEDLSPTGAPIPGVGELLSAKIIQVFNNTDKYFVVERDRLLLALEELNLGTTELVDESSQLQLGKLVGAQFMVFGGYIAIDNTMRLDLRLVNVESGAITKTASRVSTTTDISVWMNAAEDAAKDLL